MEDKLQGASSCYKRYNHSSTICCHGNQWLPVVMAINMSCLLTALIFLNTAEYSQAVWFCSHRTFFSVSEEFFKHCRILLLSALAFWLLVFQEVGGFFNSRYLPSVRAVYLSARNSIYSRNSSWFITVLCSDIWKETKALLIYHGAFEYLNVAAAVERKIKIHV